MLGRAAINGATLPICGVGPVLIAKVPAHG